MGIAKNHIRKLDREARHQVYVVRAEAEKKMLATVLQYEDQKLKVFWIAKQCVKENKDAVGDKCLQMDNGVFAFSDYHKKEV